MQKVIVIGAGVVGLSTAYYLRQIGLEVSVLDSEARPGRGASYGNGGYIQTAVCDPWNAPGAVRLFLTAWLNALSGRADQSAFAARTTALPGLTGWGLKFLKYSNAETYLANTIKNMQLCRYSVELLRDTTTREAISFSHSGNGALIVFKDASGLAAYTGLARQVAEHGISFQELDREGLLLQEPSLAANGEGFVGAVHFPSDYSGNSREYCEHMCTVLERQGVASHFMQRVNSLQADSVKVSVQTDQEMHTADAVVIAAGNHSKALAKSLGIKLPIAPAKGFSLSVPMGDWEQRPRHTIIDMQQHAGVNPLGDTLRVAGGAEFAGLKPGISQARIRYLVNLTRELFPDFAETIEPEKCDPWAGHRPMSADGLPIIGESGVDKVYLNVGHGGLGWSQSAGSGKALADLMTGQQPGIDLENFALSRFG